MFDLEPHETLSDPDESWFRVQSEAPNRGELWRVAVENRGQWADGHLFGRLLMKRRNRPALVAAHTGDLPSKLSVLGEKHLRVEVEPFGLRTSLDDCLANQKWMRSLFLNANLELRKHGEAAEFEVCLSPHGWGLWRSLHCHTLPRLRYAGQSEWTFPLIAASELALVSADALLSQLFAQGEETADFRFAREFLKLSPKEQEAHLWTWKRGDLAQLKNVLRFALLAQDELWREPCQLSWEINMAIDEAILPRRGGLLYENGSQSRAPACLHKSFARALQWFKFEVHYEAFQRHLCLMSAYTHARDSATFTMTMEAQEPTAHERLEAMLEWHAWLEETSDQT